MPFKVPSLAEVNRTVENNFSQAFYGSSGVLRAMVLKVVSKVVAGAVYMVVLFLSFIWKNSFVATADVDGLVRNGVLRNMTPKPASPARGMIEISGPEGTSIAAGTVVVDKVFGNEYEILNSVTSDSLFSILVPSSNRSKFCLMFMYSIKVMFMSWGTFMFTIFIK